MFPMYHNIVLLRTFLPCITIILLDLCKNQRLQWHLSGSLCLLISAERMAEVIERTFGVHYHRDHVGRLLREAGWSRQQPIERATQRDKAAIKQWYDERWPAIKKSRRRPVHHRLGR